MESPLNEQGRPTRKISGITAELMAAVELMNNGFSVSWPFGDTEGYDLIADSRSRLTRIQVKSASNINPATGTFRVHFRKGHKHSTRYTEEDCDFLVAVLGYSNGHAYYVIPVSAAITASTFFPPNQHPRHPDKWKTCKMEEYRNRWDLLR